jgi:hypothetical protein
MRCGGNAHEHIKHQVGIVPFAFTFAAERELELLLFQSDTRPPGPSRLSWTTPSFTS